MRTTLKKGTRAGSNGNGSRPRDFGAFTSPLGPVSRYAVWHRSPWRIAGKILGWLAIVLVIAAGALGGGVWLYLNESVNAVQAKSEAVKQTEAFLDAPEPGQPTVADRHRVRHAQGRGGESGRALGHDHAAPRRPVERHPLDALIPARPRGRASGLPGASRAVGRPHQHRLHLLRPDGDGADGQGAHGRPDQLRHHRQLQRLQADREQGRTGSTSTSTTATSTTTRASTSTRRSTSSPGTRS